MMQPGKQTSRGVYILYAVLISFFAISAILFVYPALNPPYESVNYMETESSIETNGCGSCYIMKAELWEFIDGYNDIDFISDVTNYVKWQDGWYVSYNKHYFLRVYFNTDLEAGDMIVIYAKWNTVPAIKGASIYLTNGTKVGGGEVLTKWKYYYLNITSTIPPTSVFDIVINGANPSSQNIRIDKVKCQEGEPLPPQPAWRDPETGTPIYNYQVNFNYLVTVAGNVNTSEVYLDLEMWQNVTDDNAGNATIFSSLLEKTTIHVTTINASVYYASTPVSMLDHGIVGTDNITIRVDVKAIVYGQIEGTGSWISIAKLYLSLREVKAWWY